MEKLKPIMEKLKPTYDLRSFQDEFSTEAALRISFSALLDANQLGFSKADVVNAVQSMTRRHFYKSMTLNANAHVWQDVYHLPFRGIEL